MASGSLQIERRGGVFKQRAQQAYMVGGAGGGTYGGSVVDLLPHVVADALQLRLRDVVHRPHHVGDGLHAAVAAPAGLQGGRRGATAVVNACTVIVIIKGERTGGSVSLTGSSASSK